MQTLSDTDVLAIWENGFYRHPLDRALLALGAAFPDVSGDGVADWTLGRRNTALARLRCACFGRNVRSSTSCRSCGEELEFELDGRMLAGEPTTDDGLDQPIVVDGRSFRLPTSRDLAAAATERDAVRGSIRLIENCRLDAGDPPPWSAEDLEAIGDRMAEADPLAEMRLALTCPTCATQWEETLDIASFVWEEIEARARRILLDIHSLASAYGWTEAEVLSLSASRRATYLAMVRS
jgi:hypothetical protein